MKSLTTSLFVFFSFLFLNFNSAQAEQCYLKVIDYLPSSRMVGTSSGGFYCPREQNYCYSYFGPANKSAVLDEYLKILHHSITVMNVMPEVICDDGSRPKEIKEITNNGAVEFELIQAISNALSTSINDTK